MEPHHIHAHRTHDVNGNVVEVATINQQFTRLIDRWYQSHNGHACAHKLPQKSTIVGCGASFGQVRSHAEEAAAEAFKVNACGQQLVEICMFVAQEHLMHRACTQMTLPAYPIMQKLSTVSAVCTFPLEKGRGLYALGQTAHRACLRRQGTAPQPQIFDKLRSRRQ